MTGHAQLAGDIGSFAAEPKERRARYPPFHPDLAPIHISTQSGPERFENGFFDGKESGKRDAGLFLAGTIAEFLRSKNALFKHPSMLKQLPDLFNFHQVNSDSQGWQAGS